MGRFGAAFFAACFAAWLDAVCLGVSLWTGVVACLRAPFWTDVAACLGAAFRADVCWHSLDLQNARACTGEATTPTNSPRQQATNMARMRKLHPASGMEVLSQGMRAEIRPLASCCRHQALSAALLSQAYCVK